MKRKLIVLIHTLFGLAAAVQLAAQAPAGGIQLEVVPASLEFSSCDIGATILVIARNPTAQPTPALQVTSFSDASLTLSPNPVPKALAPHRETSWQFQVKCGPDFNGGNLQIVLRSAPSANANGASDQIVTRSLPVKLRDLRPLDSIVAIDIKSTLQSLHAGDSGVLNVSVQNKTARALKVLITPSGSEFFRFDKVPPSTEIQPLSTSILPFTVSAIGRIKPGKELLLFNVLITTAAGDQLTFQASREVDVDVLGESEILKLLGVPSLFLLPGFLALSAFLLLWRMKVLGTDLPPTPPLDGAKTDFWVISITASLLITSCFLLARHDYFSYYSLGDLMILWFTSLGIGSLAYIGFRIVAIRRSEARFPQPRDTQVQILSKLKRYGKTMDLDVVTVKDHPGAWFLLLVNGGSAYICPPMLLIWKTTADANVRIELDQQLVAGGDPGVVAELCDQELKRRPKISSSIKELKWNGTDSLHPSAWKVDETAIDNTKPRKDIILQEKDE